ncbi:hypothetical protein LIER_27832 [Lithospermum erythrorhizon]|uniref:Uncharacterized protein n=1 Tax=Lithospermum erythrorhizon TaxID=34254 RepID=A0AAV3REL6_LITER
MVDCIREGLSAARSPYFDGGDYDYWSSCMETFLQAQDYALWHVVKEGPFVPKKMTLILGSGGRKNIQGSKDISENDSDEVNKEKFEYNARLKETLERKKIIPTRELNSKSFESVTDDFNNKVCAIKEVNNDSEIPTNELMGNLMAAEMVVARKKANQIKPTLTLKSAKSLNESQLEDEEDKDDEIFMMIK